MKKKRSLSGIKPTGNLHLGNYFGAIKEFLYLQEKENIDNFYFIADYHALNTIPDPKELRVYTIEIFKSLIALGINPEKSTLFLQSDIPEHTELSWLLTGITPVGLMERGHAYKDAISKNLHPNMGLFNYPLLQAADILIYDSDLVPVGADQKQHIEIARDIAEKFNYIYGDTFVIPEPMIRESVSIVPGIDKEKMSKSKNNTIDIFGSEKEIKKQIMSIVTDSTPIEEPKDFKNCAIYHLYGLFASSDEVETMKNHYINGNYGYGHAKLALFDKILEHFDKARRRMEELNKNEDEVYLLIQKGAEKARTEATNKIKTVRKIMGLGEFYA